MVINKALPPPPSALAQTKANTPPNTLCFVRISCRKLQTKKTEMEDLLINLFYFNVVYGSGTTTFNIFTLYYT